jgi:uncharacterized surface protein with fasciclin (FAS1) repeats
MIHRISRSRLGIAMAAATATVTMLTAPSAAIAEHHGSHAAMKSTVVDIAVNSPDHTTLVAAVKAAGLVETLQSKGPFTVFAPTNVAFAGLPVGTVDTLLQPANKPVLSKILTYHVVSGNVMSGQLVALIKKGKGKAKLTTVAGETLTARVHRGSIMITDAKGGTAMVTTANLKAGNGVVHVVDGVFLPG